MSEITQARIRAERRKKKVRMRIHGTSDRPRLSVYRSNKHVFVQAIDDEKKVTILSVTDMGIKNKIQGTKSVRAQKVGEMLSQKLQKNGIKSVVFDRGKNRYMGRIKHLAESMRKNGIII